MGKRVALYLMVALLLAGAGVGLSVWLTGGPVEDDEPVPVKAPEVVAVKPALDEERDVAPAGEELGGEVSSVEVLEATGSVSRATPDGEWVEIAVGQTLAVDDAVKTGESSRVTLKVGERSTIELAQQAEVKVRELSSSVQRLGLVNGRASVDYQEGGERVLRIENEDGSAVASVTRGKFSIMNTGETVAVATETGTVDLSSGGESVAVEAGEQSMVAGGAPTNPLAIPAELLLRVADPGCRVQREMYITMRGRTNPGSAVVVNDSHATVRADGRFNVRVPLKVGKNTIVVSTSDVQGREKRRVFPCVTVDPGAAIKEVDINWGAAKKKESS